MNELLALFKQFFTGLRLWVTIAPWEQGIRVRFGKWTKKLGAGVHLRIPLADSFYIQSVRLRISMLGRQTVTSSDGKPITFGGTVGYAIGDIEMLYQTLHHAEDTILNIVRAAVADYISNHSASECHSSKVEQALNGKIAAVLLKYGLVNVSIYITDFVIVKTYRLIGESNGYLSGASLNTENQTSRPA